MLVAALGYFAATRAGLLALAFGDLPRDAITLAGIFAIGTVYDLAFYAYALLPVALYVVLVPERWWYSRANRYWVHGCVLVTLYGLGFIVAAEFLFWDEFQARFNFIAVDYLVYRREVTDNIVESYPVALILLGILIVTAVIYRMLAPRIERCLRPGRGDTARWPLRLAVLAGALAAPTLAYVGLDQELHDFSSNTFANELARNGPYQFIAAFRNNELDYAQFYARLPDARSSALMKREVEEAVMSGEAAAIYDIRRFIDNPGVSAPKNIMLVMVESLSADYLGTFGNRAGLTPFLDELAGQSLLFTNFFATGTRTVRGLEAVTLSIPPTPGQSIVKRLGRETGLWSLGNVLGEQGYDTRFIYGGNGYFDNMNAFFSGNGYAVIDLAGMPKEKVGFSNAWGVADEGLYDVALDAADQAHAAGRPFFFHLMTTSNHRPYTYPEGRIDIPSGSGRAGAVKYTDWALRHLFETARAKPWFKDTVFVVVADHCAGSAGKVALPLERYRIPLMIYGKDVAPARIETIASQIDVAPTLLALLHLDYASAFFGKDILAEPPGAGRALISTYQSLGLYRPGLLSILAPNRHLEQQRNPESDAPAVARPAAPDADLERTIAYYQGASYVYDHGLNHWQAGRFPEWH
ncbi:MAG: LTA synthase family protein [Gammaproteobacteria bacterium]|nr:LTA synthase family protein [Gammaproteobacteria bacterium]